MEHTGAWALSLPGDIIENHAGELDWQAVAQMIEQHQSITQCEEGIAHAHMVATDHPYQRMMELDLLEQGADPEKITITACITHTVGNTIDGMPEMIVINAEHDVAERLINDVEEMAISEGELPVDSPFLCGNRVIQLVPTTFEQLGKLKGAYESFIALEIMMSAKGMKPEWLQIVYADHNHRFPWEPGAGSDFYQPVPARPHRYHSNVKANA